MQPRLSVEFLDFFICKIKQVCNLLNKKKSGNKKGVNVKNSAILALLGLCYSTKANQNLTNAINSNK